MFDELTDSHGWDHPRHDRRGGPIQAGEQLAKLALTDPDRTIRLIRTLKPGVNEIPVSDVVRSLFKAGCPHATLYALVEELAAKGFASDSFRWAVANAVQEAVGAEDPLPESLLNLLESWLVSVECASEDIVSRTAEGKQQQSILWGHGGLILQPSGNYPVLAALSWACLVPEPPNTERWLNILEAHLARTESSHVWSMAAWRYFRWLNLADHQRAQLFLEKLFQRHPDVLSRQECIQFVAHIQAWIDPENAHRWLDVMARVGGWGTQGYGEVLMLRRAWFPSEVWPADQLTACLDSCDEPTRQRRVGVAYSLARLWSEPEYRQLAHGYLLPLLASSEESVLHVSGDLKVG